MGCPTKGEQPSTKPPSRKILLAGKRWSKRREKDMGRYLHSRKTNTYTINQYSKLMTSVIHRSQITFHQSSARGTPFFVLANSVIYE